MLPGILELRMARIGVQFRVALLCLAAAPISNARAAMGSPQAGAQPPLVRQLGTIQSIKDNTITLTTDEGSPVAVIVKQGARMLRVEPGEKDLSHAVPLELSELQAGDRIRVRGQNSADSKYFFALEVIAIKHLDIQAKREQERADWQKRGMGGLVSAVDPSAGTLTVSVGALGGARLVTLHVAPNTILRRYAPDSVQFDDAKVAPLTQIKPGDQLRARGNRSADGSEFSAEEVVSGSFRNIAGTINSIDLSANTLVVMDLLSKGPVTVRISEKTQLRRLPPEAAQALAMRLRTEAGRPTPGTSGSAPAAAGGVGGGAGRGPGGGRDFQQLVNRLPTVTLADLQKGEAVMLVSTEGKNSAQVTAITLLGGVEPLLTAPRGTQAFTLSPWTLSSAAEGGGEANP